MLGSKIVRPTCPLALNHLFGDDDDNPDWRVLIYWVWSAEYQLRGALHPTIGVYVTSRSTLFLRCFFSRMMMMVINATKTKIKAGTWRRKVIKRWRAKMTVAKTVLLQYKYNDKYNDKKDCVKKCFLGLRPISMLSSALANWCKGRGTFTDKEGIFAQLHLLWGRCCLVQERHLAGNIQLVTIYTTHRVIF